MAEENNGKKFIKLLINLNKRMNRVATYNSV